MQDYFIQPTPENESIRRLLEKRAIKRTATGVGVAYLLLLIIPRICAYLFYGASSLFNFDAATIVQDDAFQHIWQISVSFLMMLLPAVAFSLFERKRTSELIFFKIPKKGLFTPFILIGVGVCAFANIATNTIATILEAFGISYTAPEMPLPDGAFGIILLIISTAITPAVLEEFLSRGALLCGLRQYGEAFAVFISAGFFGAMHGNVVQIPFAFIVGLILGIAVIKTGSIWTGVAIHFINNFMSVLLGELLPFGDSVYLNIVITAVYFAASLMFSFVGVYMLKGKTTEVFALDRGDSVSTFREKIGWFCFSPMTIVSIIATVATCAELF